MHNILQKYPTIISAVCFFFTSNVFAQTLPTAPTPPSINAAALYQQHCASCHGEQRTGLMGPALLPESLERTRAPEVLRVIKEGRQATQMMGFGDLLSGAEIQALADWIRTPVVPRAGQRPTSPPRASPPPCPPERPTRRCGRPIR